MGIILLIIGVIFLSLILLGAVFLIKDMLY